MRTPSSRELLLGDGELELWLLTPPRQGALAFDELDESERRRADAFRRHADRALYVAAHVALRRLLGAYLRTPAKELAFARADCPRCGGPHGRPVLTGAGPGAPHFSLSHSRGAVLIGVARAPVGVDVERVPGPERVELCRSALHPYEQRELAALGARERPPFFARLWARKEAFLKGTGVGVGGWTSEVYLGEGGPDAPPRPDGWSVLDVPYGPRHAASAAFRGPAPRTVVRRLPPEAVLGGDMPGPAPAFAFDARDTREEELP
ncbi:4'-phosphopantetheinyl transferase superfamily protein [Streptomyces sp. HUAS MG91]|uniref:4'-phosphopantetheinyl transferase superfamily protein n=1 Tax=Streptomyces tabacisoli TaxID=3156398 RepID=A0AAU8IZZ2_9ACTN